MCIVVVVISICALCIHMINVVIITCVFCLCMVVVQCVSLYPCVVIRVSLFVYIYICKAPRANYRLGAISSLSYYYYYYYYHCGCVTFRTGSLTRLQTFMLVSDAGGSQILLLRWLIFLQWPSVSLMI